MPLAGGAADKFGNRYEGHWTVKCMLDVMDELADSIRLEPPGPDGEGAEFWIRRGSGLEYHQAKRQHTTGRWTLSELERECFSSATLEGVQMRWVDGQPLASVLGLDNDWPGPK